ncbi:MAG: GGDEF domain-containing protein [Alphaproteobacteria bacterium]|nr:GGDEF domain-containing protein [Alphaproteobacteria bacterium]
MAEQLGRIGGEFADPAREARFRAERLPETLRHIRLLFAASAILNALFLVSDWRFAGTEHFWVAVPARGLVIAASLICLGLAFRVTAFAMAERVMIGWMLPVAVGVGILVSSHSQIALFAVMMLPLIVWLAVPATFRWTAIGGATASIAVLAGWFWPNGAGGATFGLVMAMAVLNVALVLVVTRMNRLVRMESLAAGKLAASRSLLEQTFEASPVPMVVVRRSDNAVLRINSLARSFFGGDRAGAGGTPDITSVYADPADADRLRQMLDAQGRLTGYEMQIRTPQGDLRDILVSTSQIEVDGEIAQISGVIDITRRKQLEEHLARLAKTDALTGLANRGQYFARAEEEMLRARSGSKPLAVVMIDLDHFKEVNDRFGHEAGDRALKATAALLAAFAPAGSLVARLGGEDFALLLPETDLAGATGVAEHLRTVIENCDCSPIAEGLSLTASFGCGAVRPAETTIEPAMGRADRALYAAKTSGRNRVESGHLKGVASSVA